MTYTSEEKHKFIQTIKHLDLKSLAVPEGESRKWYKFGAYDALRLLTMEILENSGDLPNNKDKKEDKNATTSI